MTYLILDKVVRGGVGTFGWFASVKLQTINEVFSAVVAVCTICFLLLSSVRVVLEIRDKLKRKRK